MHKSNLFFLCLVGMLLCISSCVEKRDLSKNVVIASIGTTPDGLHPFNVNSNLSTYVFTFTQKTLHATDPRTLKQIPVLIKEMPDTIGDLKTFYFEVKKGIKWDDGTDFTGADVVFTMKMTVCPLTNNPGAKSIYASVIDEVWTDPNNPYKVYYSTKSVQYTAKTLFQEIKMQQKEYWDPENITDEIVFKNIENLKASKKIEKWFREFNGNENNFNPDKLVGLGAYQVKELKEGSHVTLIKKQNHWTKGDTLLHNLAYPDKIVLKVISDKSAVKLALKSERIDVDNSMSAKTLRKIEKSDYFKKNYSTSFRNRYVYTYMGLNTKPDLSYQKPFFVDVRVRRAIAHLVPVDEIIEVLLKGDGGRQASSTSVFNYRYNDTLDLISLNINKAKELLTEAGWVDTDGDHVLDKEFNGKQIPFKFKVSYMSGGSSKDLSLIHI